MLSMLVYWHKVNFKMTKLISKLKLKLGNNHLILVALIASSLVHVLLITKFSINNPQLESKKLALSVNLSKIKTAASNNITTQVNSASLTPALHKTSTIAVKKSQSTALNNQHDPVEDKTIIQPATTLSNINPNEAASATETSLNATSSEKPAPPAYRYVEIEYDVISANISGQSRESFNIDKNGSYILSSLLTYKNSVGNVIRTERQRSEGTISDSGLIPGYYAVNDDADINKTKSSSFVWQEGVINQMQNNQNKIEQLLENSQDLLSFKYQFMFTSRPDVIYLPIADGKEYKEYTFKLMGEETILNKIGELNTIHFQSSDQNETIDLWLAIEYQYLPIKSTLTDANGAVIYQQMASSISTANR